MAPASRSLTTFSAQVTTLAKSIYIKTFCRHLVLSLERPISAKLVEVDAYEAAAYPLYRSATAESVRA